MRIEASDPVGAATRVQTPQPAQVKSGEESESLRPPLPTVQVKPTVKGQDDQGKNKEKDNELARFDRILAESIERANKALTGYDRYFEYSVHEKTNDIMVKVVDKETKEIIREVPPKKIIDLIASMMEMAGIFIDKKA
ncbi:MAG: flagellar protein FlaG [Oscillospiraceae bacterium]|nr:flagellar protein FlaG [Oscillospiraceae bacterium]